MAEAAARAAAAAAAAAAERSAAFEALGAAERAEAERAARAKCVAETAGGALTDPEKEDEVRMGACRSSAPERAVGIAAICPWESTGTKAPEGERLTVSESREGVEAMRAAMVWRTETETVPCACDIVEPLSLMLMEPQLLETVEM